jgi:hypothetical protein
LTTRSHYSNVPPNILVSRQQLQRGFIIAVVLWLLFLVVTAYASAATLLARVGSTDVMRAASGGAWTGRIAWEIVYFLVVVVLLHLFFAALTWSLAYASAVVSVTARQKFGLIVVGWFSVLAGATLAYNALWYPRTLDRSLLSQRVIDQHWPLAPGSGAVFLRPRCSLSYTPFGAGLRCCGVHLSECDARPAQSPSVGIGVTAAIEFWPATGIDLATAATNRQPHIIMLGIDSLRLEQLRRFGGTGVTPNLDRFLEQADLFKDATTPAARTFSSWVAILTGRSPTVRPVPASILPSGPA